MSEEALSESYPHAARIRRAVFEGENKLPRLFLGLAFQTSYIISQLTSFNDFPYDQSVPNWVVDVFARSGFAGVLLTVNVAQLFPSILAQKYPAAFLQYTPLVYPSIWLALGIESIGVLDATHVIVYILEKVYFGNSDGEESDKVSENMACSITSTVKCIFSCLLTLASAAFVCYSIAMGYSILELAPSALYVCLVLMYVLVFYCGGTKIAIVTCSSFTREELVERSLPTQFYDILTSKEMWDRAAAFLQGRQMLVVPAGFFIAQITFFSTGHETLSPILYYILIGLGLPGMLLTIQLAQLAPQIIASRHPRRFLALPGARSLVRLGLLIDQLGFTRCAFVLRSTVECIAVKSCIKRANSNDESDHQDDDAHATGSRDPLLIDVGETCAPYSI